MLSTYEKTYPWFSSPERSGDIKINKVYLIVQKVKVPLIIIWCHKKKKSFSPFTENTYFGLTVKITQSVMSFMGHAW